MYSFESVEEVGLARNKTNASRYRLQSQQDSVGHNDTFVNPTLYPGNRLCLTCGGTLMTSILFPANHHVPTGVPECRASDVEELVNTLVQLDEEGRQQLIAARQRCMVEWREVLLHCTSQL